MSEQGPGQREELDPQVVELAGRIFDLARSGDAGALGAYVDAGVPVDLCNGSGDSLLMLAAYHGHADAVRALLGRGAAPDKANDRGQTPLAGAVFKGADEVVEALLAGGADPRAGTPTALDTARMFGKDELVERFGG
ncbi:ankyrin repeat domain-containing protein [Phaeacidiphilus oryzae]|uniref:ankyrin repeat domain-containing protein n=1 Tax=Phaeacidiphilus oryzae TaxID=348818 RepID=UPI00068CC6F1|nr:ankyrin repeat domain-containing protein [Phaeacidiphilus oryzae]